MAFWCRSFNRREILMGSSIRCSGSFEEIPTSLPTRKRQNRSSSTPARKILINIPLIKRGKKKKKSEKNKQRRRRKSWKNRNKNKKKSNNKRNKRSLSKQPPKWKMTSKKNKRKKETRTLLLLLSEMEAGLKNISGLKH